MAKRVKVLTLILSALSCPFGLTPSSASSQSFHRAKVQIVTGPTVHVSKAFPELPHYENLAAGDAKHSGRLITCSMVFPREIGKNYDQYCYVSFDSGKTWEPTLKATQGRANGDPTAVYGQGDTVYVASLVLKDLDNPTDPEGPRSDNKTVVFRSNDGGRTWSESARFQFTDRPYIYVDKTGGQYDGRVYIVGANPVPGINATAGAWGVELFRSVDDGKTFQGPVRAMVPRDITSIPYGGVVLSDSTLVVSFVMRSPANRSEGPIDELHVLTSKDGGETFGRSVRIATNVDRRGILGQLAVDSGSKPFKDRLYVVYSGNVSDRSQIQSSYSVDNGKTWSKPLVVNDDRSPEDGGKGPDHILPSVAVNKDGVVLVTWYDRREAKDNIGWRIRAAVSLDGGETFSASVPVTDHSSAFTETTLWDLNARQLPEVTSSQSLQIDLNHFFGIGGDTSGLAVDADGTFHPTWIDNRTGIAQLWTAPVKVSGRVVKHGSADLAELEDISKFVKFEFSRPDLDRKTGRLSVTARLKNISNDTVEGPVKARVIALESELGVAEITNADNGERGTGAVWNFSGELPEGRLPSMKPSATKTLTFGITDLRPLRRSGRSVRSGIVNLNTKVFGKLRKESGKQP